MRSCAGPANRKPVCGAGRNASCRRVTTVSCTIRHIAVRLETEQIQLAADCIFFECSHGLGKCLGHTHDLSFWKRQAAPERSPLTGACTAGAAVSLDSNDQGRDDTLP